MGIKGLNRFLRNACAENIRQVSLWELNGKTIAIDTSIYLYKFNGDGSELIDGFYHMISVFKYNKIVPLFVFDGKPPAEKNKLIEQRRIKKINAQTTYNEIIESNTSCKPGQLLQLRKQFIRVSRHDVFNVKKLLRLMGVSYYECDGESDAVCVKLVETNMAYACMSEDMDMFVYGCTKVLRYLSLLNSTVVVYDFKRILQTLNITFPDFKTMCIVSGTDYNLQTENNISLNEAYVLYRKYKSAKCSNSYHDWLSKEGYVKNVSNFKDISIMFDTNIIECIPKIVENNYNVKEARAFLEHHGFVFV